MTQNANEDQAILGYWEERRHANTTPLPSQAA